MLCLLALLLPTTIFWPLGPSGVAGALPIFVAPGLALGEVVALLAALLLIPRHTWTWPRVTLPFALLIGMGVLTTPFAVSPSLAVVNILRWSIAAFLFVMLCQGGVNRQRMMRWFLLGLAVQVGVAAAQVAVQHPLGLPGELALWPDQSGAAVLTVDGQRWLRGYGLTFHPNILGGFLAVGLILLLPNLQRWPARLLWLWLALGLLITFSRSAWLAAALTLPLLALWLARQWPELRRSLAITVGGALLIGMIAVVPLAPQLLSRFAPTGDTGTEFYALDERGVLAQIALQFIGDAPLTGVGAGNFATAMVTSGLPHRAHPVHNVPLLLAAEIGILGAVAWLWLWLQPVATTDLRRLPLAPALLAAWLALCIIALWDFYPWGLSTGRLLTATLLGWWAGRDELVSSGVAPRSSAV